MTTHTPGPWHITKLDSPVYGSDGNQVAAGTGIGAGSAYIGTLIGKRREANGRLIVCAPDLLAALQALVHGCRHWSNQEDYLLVNARRAIARATNPE